MEAKVEEAANEIKRLKACINNLISVQALPAIWSGGKPFQIVSASLDMLLKMLSLDFAYARLKDATGGASLEMARLAQDRNLSAQPQMIGRALSPWLCDFSQPPPSRVRNPIGDGEISVLLLRLGLQAELGVCVAGSKRADFPTQTERLLLNLAANQVVIGLQEARLLGEQKRVAEELDQSVAQRTSQLLAANEELEKEIAERKRAEENLRHSEAFLAEGQRISHTGSWGWNVSSGKLAWSEEHFRIFGFDPGKTEPSFQLFLETVHPEDRSFIKRSLDEAVRERSGFDLEFRIALADGSIKHVQGIGRPVIGEPGEVDRYIGTTVDLTERKRAEEALKESEERYRVLVELSPNSICVHRDGELLYVNPAGVRLFGATDLAQLVGRSVLDFIHPDSLPIVRERMRQVRAGDTAPLIEEKFVTLNGEVRDVEVTSIPIIYERAPAAQVIIRDISERKQAEEKLRASEQVARGQVEALTYSLDVLATAPAPDKFIGQMLSTIGRLLGAQSVILWLLNEATESLVLRAAAQGANFAAADHEHPFVKNPSSWKDDPGLRELFFSGAPVACEDLEHDPYTSSELREYLKSGGTKKFLRIPTLVGGRVRGFIGIRHGDRPPYRPEEVELAQALSHQAMLAIQLNEFAEQSRQAAVLEERNRMARDIHDTLAQGFTGVIVQLEAAEDAISCRCRKEADNHLHRAAELARRSLSEARRSVHALRPRALQEHNFWEALKGIIKNTTTGTALRTRFEAQGRLPALPELWQENLLHIGQEALTNTLKYARARNFETRVSYKTRELRLELRDDGNGFKVKDQNDGMGLTGMRERVEQMGGTLQITSARGKGTKIVVTLPYNPDAGSPRNDSLLGHRSFSSRRSVAKANGERGRAVETLHP
jgi:PAS domain S-box-containing protein